MRFVGARARGKKHKQDGTNCDDAFAVATEGQWTFTALSDGAGSKAFSRVGSTTACNAAVAYLKNGVRLWSWLEPFSLQGRMGFGTGFLKRLLRGAAISAYRAVVKEFEKRVSSLEHIKYLNRKLRLSDFDCTLLLTAHRLVRDSENMERSLVAGCQVGDGIMAMIDPLGFATLIGTPTYGNAAGETTFLTSDFESLSSLEVTLLSSPCHALLAMTDGVEGDYFPTKTGMTNLFGDLVLNGIIGLPLRSTAEARHHLDKIIEDNFDRLSVKLHRPHRCKKCFFPSGNEISCYQCGADLDQEDKPFSEPFSIKRLKELDCYYIANRLVSEHETRKVKIRSIEILAEMLKIMKTEHLIVNHPRLLESIAEKDLLDGSTQDERLLAWLDSYYLRASFDDRTLVTLYRKSA